MKNLKISLLCFVAAILLFGCKKDKDKTINVPDFSSIKSSDWRSSIGDTVEVEGFLKINDDGTGVLLATKDDYYVNTILPEKRYVALSADIIDNLDRDDYLLAKVKIKAVVKVTRDPGRTLLSRLTALDISQLELRIITAPVLLEPLQPIITRVENFCDKFPGLCTVPPPTPAKYALLYSGGINKDNAHMRYWNDMKLYYNVLVNVYGYDPDNIIVVYKDGDGEDEDIPVNYAATLDGINGALTDLRNNMTVRDSFFFFMTNHGGTQKDQLTIGDEDGIGASSDTIDEITYYYDSEYAPYDDNVRNWVNSLNFAGMVCVMEQCYSGGMIYDLRGPNRVIITAANETEVSYGGATYDDFVLLFASAMVGGRLDKVLQPIDADTNNDGKTSLVEAFIWAKENDPHTKEHPQYEDSGDGSSVSLPSNNATGTGDGAKGKNIFGL